MAPPRQILRQQLEVLTSFLEANKDMAKGLPPGTPATQQAAKHKWIVLAKRLNAVPSGALKTPDGWKKYWFTWRHKCRRKVADVRRYQSTNKRFTPLNDLEVRVLELSGRGSVTPVVANPNELEDFLADDSDSEPLVKITVQPAQANPVTIKSKTIPDTPIVESRPLTPPPKWALELEERRIAAEERMAKALESMAAAMRAQEARRAVLDDRIADAVALMAATVQDMNSGIQQAVHHFQQLNPTSNGPRLKDVFL